MSERSLAGLGALITGAASGMGRAMGQRFARAGARVALVDRNAQAVSAVAEVIRGEGGVAHAFGFDLSDREAIPGLVADAAAALGGLDVIVNNAGISEVSALDGSDYGRIWDSHLAVMLTAPALLIRAALPHLRASRHPRVLNFASTEGLGATAGLSAYSAAKAGIIGLTRSLAVELGKEGITVNCICPGPVETGMTAVIPAADKQVYAHRRTALRRYGQPEEVAEIALGFCIPGASFLTGAIVPVDGGLVARNA